MQMLLEQSVLSFTGQIDWGVQSCCVVRRPDLGLAFISLDNHWYSLFESSTRDSAVM